MGCLFEFFFQFFIEGTVALLMSVYLKISSSPIPNTDKFEKIKNAVTTVSVLQVLCLFLGVIFLLPDDPLFNTIGKYMTFIPLSIIILQLIIGIIFTVINNKSK